MRIFDQTGKELFDPDLSLGYLKADTMVFTYEEVIGVPEQGHYEVIAQYPNGGRDVRYVVDVPGVEAQEAREEEAEIFRYILYTPEELAAMEEERNQPTPLERIRELEEALQMLLSGVTE